MKVSPLSHKLFQTKDNLVGIPSMHSIGFKEFDVAAAQRLSIERAGHRCNDIAAQNAEPFSALAPNYADSNLPTLAFGIFETRFLRQFLGLEWFRQNDEFKPVLFEQHPSHRFFHVGIYSMVGREFTFLWSLPRDSLEESRNNNKRVLACAQSREQRYPLRYQQ
jgi:hypothetical protein